MPVWGPWRARGDLMDQCSKHDTPWALQEFPPTGPGHDLTLGIGFQEKGVLISQRLGTSVSEPASRNQRLGTSVSEPASPKTPEKSGRSPLGATVENEFAFDFFG